MSSTTDRQQSFWDRRAQQYDKRVKRHDSCYDKTIDRASSLLGAADEVLDFGCASGEISLALAPHARRVHGIDVSGRMVELARRKAADAQIDNVQFDRIDVFDARLPNGSFSTVVAFNVLHLVDDAHEALVRLHELLAPGGSLISLTPCLGEWGRPLRFLIGMAQKVGFAPPIRSLTFAELETLVSGGGFEIVESTLWDEKNKQQWIVARR